MNHALETRQRDTTAGNHMTNRGNRKTCHRDVGPLVRRGTEVIYVYEYTLTDSKLSLKYRDICILLTITTAFQPMNACLAAKV
jgi:hypothetical protein